MVMYMSQKNSWITDNAIYSKWISNYADLKFSFYYLSNIKLNRLAGGSGQPYISQQILNTLLFPLPPLEEQKLLKQYRQSVLKHAFEGKLTENWRKKIQMRTTNF